MIRSATLALCAVVFAAPALAADDISNFPGVDALPAGYTAVDNYVGGLGQPYMMGGFGELPSKPVYWVNKGKIIGFSIVIDEKQISGRQDVNDLKPMAGLPPIDHINLDFDFAHGQWTVPSWSLQVEFVSEEYLRTMTGD